MPYPSHPKGTFGFDRVFLQAHDLSAIVLGSGPAQILVSPKYQARVFTSTLGGDAGESHGWINYEAFEGTPDSHPGAYGGENRVLLGPSDGQPMVSEPWLVSGTGADSVALYKEMMLEHHAGMMLSVKLDRVIRLLTPGAIDNIIGQELHAGLQMVGYTTLQTLTNTGSDAWNEHTRMPCLWVLDTFPVSDSTVVVLPYQGGDEQAIFIKADGKSRAKVGIKADQAGNVAGAYDPVQRKLTIIQYNVNTTARYLNQEWDAGKEPFGGDVVSVHNNGPHYTLETFSPAAFLTPGSCLHHRHTVLHCSGPETALDHVCQTMLNVSLENISHALT